MKQIKTETAIISIDEDQIVLINMLEGAIVDEMDLLNINLALNQITQNRSTLRLIDIRANWKMTTKAKKIAEIQNKKMNVIARAFLVSSIVKSTLFTFLQKFNTENTPQKFFTNKDEAKAWLLGFRNK